MVNVNKLLFFIVIIFQVNLVAQPENDNCEGALELTSGNYTLGFGAATYSGVCDIDCMLTLDQGNLCSRDLWYRFSLLDSVIVYLSANLTFGPVYLELYSGTCSSLYLEHCGNAFGFSRKLPPGNYFVKVSMAVAATTYLDVDICIDAYIDPIENVRACESYTLPPITGKNLSGNQAYYQNAGGGGTKYLPGDVITSSRTLYAYDNPGISFFCSESQSFSIDIKNGGITYLPYAGGEWSDENTWFFLTPDVCDDVIINQDKVVWIDNIYTPTAYCKTIEIASGSEFTVFFGSQLEVGTK